MARSKPSPPETQASIDAGQFDSREMLVILNCIRRWHDEGVWGLWLLK